ncbi:MAG: peptidoglycan DD-metalloendopeptidase family protein [Micropepsaceae bacterium]
MTPGFWARARERVTRLFPERQIYHRSDGRVQFVVLTPRFQIAGVLIGLSCLGWIAYASVMTAFKDEIVAAKEEKLRQVQTHYEAELARMRLDYDDLSGKLALAEERFETSVAAIEKRQTDLQTAMVEQEGAGEALDEVMQRAATVRALGLGPDAPAISSEEDPEAAGGIEEHDHADETAAPAEAAPAPAPAATKTETAPAAPADKQALLDNGAPPPLPLAKPDAVRVAEAHPVEEAAEDHAALPAEASEFLATGRNRAAGESFAALATRLEDVIGEQQTAAAALAAAAAEKENSLRDVLTIAGMNADAIAPRLPDAQGGPYIPMGVDAAKADLFARDPNLDVADATLARVATLQTAMLAIPLANPLPSVTRISSGFGGRSDPFNGGRAFHSGLDFKSGMGAPIIATAPGVVTIAEWHGGYGRMVEIDHGYGLKTRYAHLSSIDVVEGQKVAFGEKVGGLGSTGRSTGPHLHYEVWYDGQARNPWNYLKAGANVLQRQGS